MAKIFTPSNLFLQTAKKEKSKNSLESEDQASFEPNDATIDFLLNYSKSLTILHSKSLGSIDHIGN